MFGVPKFNDLELKFSWSFCLVGNHIPTKWLSKNILFFVLHMSANNASIVQFLNNEDGSKINLLVKSHHYEFFPNSQIRVLKKNYFLIFTN